MDNPRNKANLLYFLATCFKEKHHAIPNGNSVMLGGMMEDGSCTLELTSSTCCPLDLACSDHEEADSRIVAHLAYYVNHLGYTRAVIHATDTDIILSGLYHLSQMSTLEELWVQKTGQYLPLHLLMKELCLKVQMESFEVGATLLATYSLSGCDTVSYPYNRGKRRAAKVALDLVGHLPNLAQFGHESNVLDDHINEARVFWTHLYGRPGFASLDFLRQHLFSSSKSDLRLLPVTEDAFNLHVLRALYQLMIFKRAHLCNLALPPATEFGRNIVNGRLVLILMTKKAKPGIGKTVSCKCKSSKCLSKGCSCERANVP
jgi:hypothetical protein